MSTQTLVGLSIEQLIEANTNTAVIFDTVVEDSLNTWNSLAPSRITVPSGMTRAKGVGGVYFENRPNYVRAIAVIAVNGIWGWGHQHFSIAGVPLGGTNDWSPSFGLQTSWLPVSPGDYFELIVHQTNWSNWPGTPDAVNLIGAGEATWLSVEFA